MRASVFVGILCLCVGCRLGAQPNARYVEPPEADAHADVLLTFTYAARPAQWMTARLFVDGREVELSRNTQSGGDGMQIRVPAKALLTSVRVEFWNEEQKTEMVPTSQTYMYGCGVGPNGVMMMCSGTTVGAYPHQRVVKTPVAECSAASEFRPAAGSRWHLALAFNGNNACTLTPTEGTPGAARPEDTSM